MISSNPDCSGHDENTVTITLTLTRNFVFFFFCLLLYEILYFSLSVLD